MKTKGLIIALFAILATSTTFAQTTQTGVLEERIAKLEESNSKWSKIVEKLPTISGYTFIRYQYNDAASQTNTFDIRRARLSLSGKPAKWFEYKIQLEFASSPKIMDAYAKFKIDPMFNVQVGQMKIPFSIENPLSPTSLEFIDNAKFIGAYLPTGGRDIGLQVSGGFFPQEKSGKDLIEYTVAVMNGNEINKKDDNTAKDFSGNLKFNICKNLMLQYSLYEGKMGEIHHDANNHKSMHGAGAWYNGDKFNVRSEYYHVDFQGIKGQSCYAQVAYNIKSKVYPAFRFDYIDHDLDLHNNSEFDYSVGINYVPAKFVGLQVNYTCKTFGDPSKHTVNNIAAQCFFKF